MEAQIYRITSWEEYKLSRQTMSKYGKNGLPWIPLYVDQWLFGSIRYELEPDEQAVFIDLLALASKDDGYIRASKTMPYPLKTLTGMFNKSEELIKRTIKKCLSKGVNKLQQVSLQNCQPPLHDCQDDGENVSLEKSREEKIREDNIQDDSNESSNKPEKQSEVKSKDPRKPLAREIATFFYDKHVQLRGCAPKDTYATILGECKALVGDVIEGEFRPRYPDANGEPLAKLKRWIPKFLISVDPRIQELGGYTIGVLRDWLAREEAKINKQQGG